MSPLEIVALLALTGYAIYKQTQRNEVVGSGRFKLPITYAVVAVLLGGISRPDGSAEWLLFGIGVALSVAVGLARGRLTRMWIETDGSGPRVYSQGTALTVGLFVGLVSTKFAMGTIAYFNGVSDDGGFGEILLMIAVMVAFQAELIWRRAKALLARDTAADTVTPRTA
jgi:hypothetical protein